MLHQTTDLCYDGVPLVKTISVKEDLSLQVKLGAIPCELDSTFPKRVSSYESFIAILRDVAASTICHGTINQNYRELGKEIYCAEGTTLIGSGKSFSRIGASEAETFHYFSSHCAGFISEADRSIAICTECRGLDSVMKSRLHRFRSSLGTGIVANTNIRYLTKADLNAKYEEEKRRRVNAEKREQLAKKRLKLENEMKTIIEKDHEDLKRIYEAVSKTPDFLKENTGMALFWDVQREMLEKKKRAWHPR